MFLADAFVVPVRAPSTANLREHFMARARRTARQKSAARLCCPAWTRGALLHIRLTRVGPRRLDTDNLASSLKAVRDGVASWLRVDDGSPLVEWDYAQETGAPSVKVEVWIAVSEERQWTQATNTLTLPAPRR